MVAASCCSAGSWRRCFSKASASSSTLVKRCHASPRRFFISSAAAAPSNWLPSCRTLTSPPLRPEPSSSVHTSMHTCHLHGDVHLHTTGSWNGCCDGLLMLLRRHRCHTQGQCLMQLIGGCRSLSLAKALQQQQHGSSYTAVQEFFFERQQCSRRSCRRLPNIITWAAAAA